MDIEVSDKPLVRINAPEWYQREDFREFLNNGVDWEDDPRDKIATWHTKGEPGEYSDLFVTYDNGEGSDALRSGGDETDANLIPQDIWDQICKKMDKRGIDYALLWISNLGQPDN